MPSAAWKLARAASRAAASAASGTANHPSCRYHLVGGGSSAASPPPPLLSSEFDDDEEAHLPAAESSEFNSECREFRPYFGRPFNLDMRSDKKGMPFDEKDLESEQTLWALYNRWCSYFNLARFGVEKDYRFNIFKETVHFIHQLRNADLLRGTDLPRDLELNHLRDVAIDEFCPPKRFLRRR